MCDALFAPEPSRDDGCAELAAALVTNTSLALCVLDLRENDYTSKGAGMMLEVYRTHPCLSHLRCS